MAETFFNALADPARARALSAGTTPGTRAHRAVISAMAEFGFDLSGHQPRLLTEEETRLAALLVTMGCGESCPYVPGLEIEDWELPDPAKEPIEGVRKIRDQVRARVEDLLNRRGWA
jgi:arsenate reductase